MALTRDKLTQSELKRRLSYDPDTGLFTRLTTHNMYLFKGRIAGCLTPSGYIMIAVGVGKFPAHRLAWFYMYGEFPKGLIDHKNGIRTDNRIDNLRVVDHVKNTWNGATSSRNKSGYKGVSWHKKAKRWQAQLVFLGTSYHLGYFDTVVEAASAYEELALRLRGEHHRRQKVTHHPKHDSSDRNTNRYTNGSSPPSRYKQLLDDY